VIIMGNAPYKLCAGGLSKCGPQQACYSLFADIKLADLKNGGCRELVS